MAPRPPLKPTNGEQKLSPPPPPLQQSLPPIQPTTDESALENASDSDLRTLSDRLSQMRLRTRALTMEEVSKHCTDGDVWIAVQGKVYDLSKWCDSHPGGKLAIMNVAGKDATDPFLGFHPPDVWKKLALFQIGVVRDYRMGPLQTELHRIREELYRDGKFETDWLFYAKLWAFHLSLLALAVGLIFYGNNTLQSTAWWPYLLSAAALGLFWQQIAFHGHDLGHNALFQDYRRDWLGSLWVTFLFGVSGQWWKRNHNTHHLVTNSVEHDPDIQHLPFLAISEKVFRFGQYFSSYYQRYCTFDESAKYFVSRQHFLYLLVMILARYNLYVQSALLILNTRIPMYKRHVEATVFSLYFVWLGALLFQLPSLFTVLVYLFVSHAVAGIIHVQITLSHFACDVYYGRGYEIGDEQSFFRTQLETSVDVDCPEWFDWFHGGLQFQVEHHVFPRVPRHNLRYVMNKYMKPLAKKYNLPYQSLTFTQLLSRVLQVLKVAATHAESATVYTADGKPVVKSEGEAQAINQARLRRLLMAEG